MLKHSLISNPTARTIELLRNKMIPSNRELINRDAYGAIALIQAPIHMLFACADSALKSGNVVAVEIVGNCPQSVASLAFFGDMDAVKSALAAAVYAQEQCK